MKKEDLLKLKLENKSNSVIRNLISTIIGELDRKSKNPSEAEVMSVIKKIRDADMEVTQTEQIKVELEFLNSLIPSNLSLEEINSLVYSLSFTKIGEYMSYFKENYTGRYDGKELSKIVKEKLQNN
jgi:uncharacterized protein YqeY